jgi:hypothetical protein
MSLPEQPRKQLSLRWSIPVIGFVILYWVVALLIQLSWNQVASSLHTPPLSYGGASGLEGLIWIVVAMLVTGYLVAVRDWGE